jgi:hypothetical protein
VAETFHAGAGAGAMPLDAPSAVTVTFQSPLTQWWAPRTDGRDGVGTAADPRDAGTAVKFDLLMASLLPHTRVHLFAGEYLTHGCRAGLRGLRQGQEIIPEKPVTGFSGSHRLRGLRQGQEIIGSGREVTKIKLAPTWSGGEAGYVGSTAGAYSFRLPGTNTNLKFRDNIAAAGLTEQIN